MNDISVDLVTPQLGACVHVSAGHLLDEGVPERCLALLNRHGVLVFVELCTDHIALEETVVYPESRAHWARAVEARALREKVRPA